MLNVFPRAPTYPGKTRPKKRWGKVMKAFRCLRADRYADNITEIPPEVAPIKAGADAPITQLDVECSNGNDIPCLVVNPTQLKNDSLCVPIEETPALSSDYSALDREPSRYASKSSLRGSDIVGSDGESTREGSTSSDAAQAKVPERSLDTVGTKVAPAVMPERSLDTAGTKVAPAVVPERSLDTVGTKVAPAVVPERSLDTVESEGKSNAERDTTLQTCEAKPSISAWFMSIFGFTTSQAVPCDKVDQTDVLVEMPEDTLAIESIPSSQGISFEAWLVERVGGSEEMTDAIARRLHDPLPETDDDIASLPSTFSAEWNKLLRKFSLDTPRHKAPVSQEWDAVLRFVEQWRKQANTDEVFHRYIWALALERVRATCDPMFAWSCTSTHNAILCARELSEPLMLELLNSVDTWDEACDLYLHLILSSPMLLKLCHRLAKTVQTAVSSDDLDNALMWFILSGRSWNATHALVRTKAFELYPYYAKLFSSADEARVGAETHRRIVEKNVYRFLQLGRVRLAAGILVLVGRIDDAKRAVRMRLDDPSFGILLDRLLPTE